MAFTVQQLKDLQQAGKIQGYREMIPKKGGKYSAKGPKNIPDQGKRSKGLVWLDWNLQYFANEHALSMEKEYRFDGDRKWRFDYAFPVIMTAVEFEGGIFMARSGHNTARHYTKDTEKYNRAAVLGWTVIRVTAMNYQTAPMQLRQIIQNRG